VCGVKILSIGSIPVSVSPWYLLLLLFYLRGDVVGGLIFAFAITISILVHELGHALVARHYRLAPRILLWGLGGLTFHDRAKRDRHDALIIAAGPTAGLLLGGLVFAVSLAFPMMPPRAIQLVDALLWVNILWSLVNLLPLWPLDGGQLFRLGLLQILKPITAEKVTHVVSIGLLVLAIGVAFYMQSFFLGILVAFGIWRNVQALRGDVSSGTVRKVNTEAKGMLDEARQAFAAGNYREAARLCLHIKAAANVPDAVVQGMWVILGVASARLGDHEDALRALERAPETPDVVEAKIECLFQLDRMDELEQLIASSAFRKLSAERRDEILAVVRSESPLVTPVPRNG
jgi:Zn-dependent protease